MTACDLAGQTITRKLMDSVVAHLKLKIPDMACEYFPDKPSAYVLNHPKGAFLLSYGKSHFSEPIDTTAVVQERTVSLVITTMMRSLNDRDGMIATLDNLRLAVVGFKPPNCRRKIWAKSEDFLGENSGIWSYQTVIATELMQIEF